MKIKAISSKYSDKHAIALITEPVLTPQVFEEVVRHARTPGIQALELQMVSGCLIIHSPRYTSEIRTTLEQLLTEAEDMIFGTARRAQEQAEIEHSEKQISLESAAAGFQLPIE